MSHDETLPRDHAGDEQDQGLSLEDLKRGALVIGIDTAGAVTIIDATWHGDDVLEIAYRDSDNRLGETILYRDNVGSLSLAEGGKLWSFDGDGGTFRLTAEALRIRNAHLFDPYLAVTTSLVEPLPHQITAVYCDLVPRQPLRFLLADDPGAGKTIMAGLLMRELQARGDLERCMVVCPGALADQWQDELWDKFNLDFEIITRQDFEAARGGNPFLKKTSRDLPS